MVCRLLLLNDEKWMHAPASRVRARGGVGGGLRYVYRKQDKLSSQIPKGLDARQAVQFTSF